MTGRNDQCPCGSGLKFKKCCHASVTTDATDATDVPALAKSKPTPAFTFDQFIATEYVDQLPFVAANGHRKDPVDAVFSYLNTHPIHDLEFDADPMSGALIACVKFESADRAGDFDDPYDFTFEKESIAVRLTESSPGGPISISKESEDGLSADDDFALQVNAAVLLTWMAIAKSFKRDRVPDEVHRFRKDYLRVLSSRDSLVKRSQELSTKIKTVSLEKIVLNFEPLLEAEPTSDRTKSVEPSSKIPLPLTEFGLHSKIERLRETLPDIFLTSLDQTRFRYWGERDTLKSMTDAISYRFSDGVVITAREILQSAYAFVVPSDLLPGNAQLSVGDLVQQKDTMSLKSDKPQVFKLNFAPAKTSYLDHHYEVQRINAVLNQMMSGISSRLSQQLIRVSLNTEKSRSALELITVSEIRSSADELFQWQMSRSARALLSDPRFLVPTTTYHLMPARANFATLLALQNGFVDRSNGQLWLTPIASTFRSIERSDWCGDRSLRHREKAPARFTTFSGHPPKAEMVIEGFIDHRTTAKVLTAISGFSIVAKAEADVAKYSAGQPEVHIGSEGQLYFVRRIQSENGENQTHRYLNGFSESTLKLFAVLSRGLPAAFSSDAKELAARTQPKREFDLRLLKHLGVINYVVFETLSWALRGRLSSGALASNTKEVWRLLQKQILALIGEPHQSVLAGICSKSVESKFLSFINGLVGRCTVRGTAGTDGPDGAFTTGSLAVDELQLILALIEQAVYGSAGEIFSRPRFNLFEKLFSISDGRLHELDLLVSEQRLGAETRSASAAYFKVPLGADAVLPQTLVALNPLKDLGFEIYFKGQKIEELSDSDFATQMSLNEAAPATGAGPINWFELHPKFFLHGKELSAAEASQLMNQGMIEHAGRFYLIPAKRRPSLKRLADFWTRLSAGKKTKLTSTLSEQVYPLPKSQTLEMLALRASGIPVIGGARWQQICEFYDGLGARKRKIKVPPTVNAELKDYQKIGLMRLYDLYRLGLGCILADDMGLGKTLQALAFLEMLRTEKRLGPTLIVVPTSLTYNWISEKEKFTPHLEMQTFSAKGKEAVLTKLKKSPNSVVLTTYGLLQEHKEFFQNIHWNVTVFDEAQNLKTITSQRTTVARSLISDVKIGLTGTPLENHLGEFYSLVDLVAPGSLGGLDVFRQIYVNSASIAQSDIDFLKLKTKPLVLRRTKNEILSELPEKQETRIALDFESTQKKIYRDVALSYNDKIEQAVAVDGEAKGQLQLQMLTALLRLRQACSDPAALPGVKYPKTPPKIEALAEALEEIVDAGESALVFTQFLETLDRSHKYLKKTLTCPVFVMHGGLTQTQRAAVLHGFEAAPAGAVLLMTLKTGGVGLNLTKASYVFHLEPWWNPAVENQATDRAHRMGQKRAVQVYRYIMRNSVEEKIEILKQSKQNCFNSIFMDTEKSALAAAGDNAKWVQNKAGHLSKDDFDFLLS